MKMVHAAIKVFESVKAAIVLEWPFLFVSLQRAKSKEEKKASQFRCEAVCWCCCWPVANGPPETLLPPKSRSETKTKSPRTFCFKIWYYWACWAQLMEMGVWEEVFLLLSFEPSDCSQAFWLDTLWQNYIFGPKSWLWLKKAAAVCLQLKLFTMSPICLQLQLFVYNFECLFFKFQHFVTVCYYWHYQHRHAHLFKLLYQCQKRSKERSVLLEDYYYNHFLRKKRKAK